MLEFNADTDTVKVVASYQHSQEIWQLAPHPTDAQNLVTIGNQGELHALLTFEETATCRVVNFKA